MWTQTAKEANKKFVLHVQLRCGPMSITTPLSHLANEFDVLSEFTRTRELGSCQSNCCVIHGAMNGCNVLKIH